MNATYALITTVQLEDKDKPCPEWQRPAQRLKTMSQRMDGPADWQRLVDGLLDCDVPRYRSDKPTQRTTLQVLTVNDDGTVRQRPVAWCDKCDAYKVPGTRHRCDPLRAPAAGTVLARDLTLRRWTGDRGPRGLLPDWHNAPHDDPRWQTTVRGWRLQVTAVEVEEAWSYNGTDYPAETVVRYTVTLTGDWSKYDPNDRYEYRPEPGTHQDSLRDWRAMASSMQVLVG